VVFKACDSLQLVSFVLFVLQTRPLWSVLYRGLGVGEYTSSGSSCVGK
jgi:hypothetical protein